MCVCKGFCYAKAKIGNEKNKNKNIQIYVKILDKEKFENREGENRLY